MQYKFLYTVFYLAIVSVCMPVTLAAQNSQTCRSEQCFKEILSRGNSVLSRKNATLFEYLFIDVYSIALYAEQKISVLQPGAPMGLVFHYHTAVKRSDMIDGAQKNLEENPAVDVAHYTKELAALNQLYVDVAAGDVYQLIYWPGIGLELSLNGKVLGTVQGERFAHDYFGIWLSEEPLSKSLRDRLLAGLEFAKQPNK